MKKRLITLLVLVASLFSFTARADVLVLVHGYLGGVQSWDRSGITPILLQHDWQRAGTYVAGPAGIQLIPALHGKSSLINIPVHHGLKPVDGSAIVSVLSDL